MKTEGYVYVIEDTPDICKIGFSFHFPTKRGYNLCTKFHREFVLKGAFFTDDVRKEERDIHNIFESYRVRGEWFRLSYEEIVQKCKECKIFFHEIGHLKKMMDFINNAKYHLINGVWHNREDVFNKERPAE